MDTLRTLKINYQLDNGTVGSVNWTGNLAKCGEVTLSLPAGNAAVGTHILTVYTTDPNGSNDQVTTNDTLRKTFSVYAAAATPLFEGFENSVFPTPNWGVQNVNGGTTFERSTVASKTGTASMMISNPNNRNANGAIDYFISPIVQNSASFDSVHVDFDMAYKAGVQYPGSTVFALDTLEILATGDCGATFTSVWKKWGDALQTIDDPNYPYSAAFAPRATSEWKRTRIYLTPLVGSSNFQLYFSMKGNKQNNLWLDNINITSQKLPQRLKDQGYLIYPNPFNNTFLIHHSAVEPPVDLQSVQVFNSAGQLVWDKRYNGNADRQITVDLKNLSKGMYILKMIYSNKTVVERIVKN
ncbi:MAG: T9SS type A sorting domain-containing protein [Chitinophagaceae bacterium]|nr:T9SS type A sorting domain-containing protein [Chitinophagaceae bacterium]